MIRKKRMMKISTMMAVMGIKIPMMAVMGIKIPMKKIPTRKTIRTKS
jgi:hypothetical protein